MSSRLAALFLALIATTAPLHAASLTQTEVDAALAFLSAEKKVEIACLKDFHTEIDYSVEQKDINGDGTPELIVKSVPKALGEGPSQGSTSCFGWTGQHVDLLTGSAAAGWTRHFGTDIHGLEFRPRPDSAWPDIETTGPGFCFPIYRMEAGRYQIYKGCNAANQHVTPASDFEKSLAMYFKPIIGVTAPVEFEHNGSLMNVDAARGIITYKRPKASIARTVKPGTLLFEGQPWNPDDPQAQISGLAYTFKRGCAPAAYQVSGQASELGRVITLAGAAPMRQRGGCRVIGFNMASAHTSLAFTSRNWKPDPSTLFVNDYAGRCGTKHNCTVDIDQAKDGFRVSVSLQQRSGSFPIVCSLEGIFKPSALGLRGRLGQFANIQIRSREAETITLSGLPKAACGVSMTGQYTIYVDY